MVNSYYHEFTALANRVDDIPTRVLISYFISGLKKDLQGNIIPLKPTSLPRAASLARLYEDKYFPTHKPAWSKSSYPPNINVVHAPGKFNNSTPTISPPRATITNTSQGSSAQKKSSPFSQDQFSRNASSKGKGTLF